MAFILYAVNILDRSNVFNYDDKVSKYLPFLSFSFLSVSILNLSDKQNKSLKNSYDNSFSPKKKLRKLTIFKTSLNKTIFEASSKIMRKYHLFIKKYGFL